MIEILKKHPLLMIFLVIFIILIFPFNIFIPQYRDNPLLYLAKQDMKKILNEEKIYVDYDHGSDLEKLYSAKFNGTFPYKFSQETQRLSNLENGGQPFWECIKKGKLYISIKPQNVVLTYRYTNHIGTCELTTQRIKSNFRSSEQRCGTLYYDKRLRIPVASLTDHYCFNTIGKCTDPNEYISLQDILKMNTPKR